MCPPAADQLATTNRSGSGTGNFSSNAALTSVKMAVLAPMASASDRTATAVNARSRARMRAPYTRSRQRLSIQGKARRP